MLNCERSPHRLVWCVYAPAGGVENRLSFVAMLMIEVLSTLVNPNNASVYLLIDTGMNIPRFLALGIVVGHLYDKLNGGV
jgi:hypothetical protein